MSRGDLHKDNKNKSPSHSIFMEKKKINIVNILEYVLLESFAISWFIY